MDVKFENGRLLVDGVSVEVGSFRERWTNLATKLSDDAVGSLYQAGKHHPEQWQADVRLQTEILRTELELRRAELAVKRSSFTGDGAFDEHGWYANSDGTVSWLYGMPAQGDVKEFITLRDRSAIARYEKLSDYLDFTRPAAYRRL